MACQVSPTNEEPNIVRYDGVAPDGPAKEILPGFLLAWLFFASGSRILLTKATKQTTVLIR